MIKNILGTQYENRQMKFNIEVNSIEDIINNTGAPYVKAKCLLPVPFVIKNNRDLEFEQLVNEVNWSGTQMLGVGVISPASGYYYLQVFYKAAPVVTMAYFWETDGKNGIIRAAPPKPCTRELEIIKELTDSYSALIRTPCTEADLRKYAASWPEDRMLV